MEGPCFVEHIALIDTGHFGDVDRRLQPGDLVVQLGEALI